MGRVLKEVTEVECRRGQRGRDNKEKFNIDV